MNQENKNTTGEIPSTGTLRPAPTLKVIIKGLALLCFSKNHDRSELGFLTVPDNPHPLIIWINDNRRPVRIPKGSVVEINPKNAGVGEVFREANNDADFGLLVDLNKHHGSVKVTNPHKFFAKVYINNSTFYSEEKSVFAAELQQIGGNAKKPLSLIGKNAGANLYNREIEILLDGRPLEFPEPLKSGDEITIQYQCPIKFLQERVSDFKYVYDIVETLDGVKYDLVYMGDEPPQLSLSEIRSVSEVLMQTRDFFRAHDLRAIKLDREKFLIDLDYVIDRTSCEVACQIVTIGGEFNDLEPGSSSEEYQ